MERELYDLLTQEDKETITAWIDKYADYSAGLGLTCSVDFLLRFWNINKTKSFGKIFAENLILERDISYKVTNQEITYKMLEDEEFLDDVADFVNSIHYHIAKDNFGETRYFLLTEEQRKADDVLAYHIKELFSTTNLASNIYDGDTFKVSFNGKTMSINKGMKTIKAITKLGKMVNLAEIAEDFRIKHSMFLNQKTFTGTLCLSVHPLDFLTMSDNTYNWESCMRWTGDDEGGDYRIGTVEMMNSGCVIEAYLRGDDLFQFDENYRWNSKKWRELFVVNEDIILSLKGGYPYICNPLTEKCIEWIKELMYKYYQCTYMPINTLHNRDLFDINNHPVYLDIDVNYMYNDFYDPRLGCLSENFIEKFPNKNRPDECFYELNISGELICMSCGQRHFEWDETSHVIGTCCENIQRCECCGQIIPTYEAYYSGDDELYCEYCYNDYCERDIMSGEYYNRNSVSLEKFYVTRNNDSEYFYIPIYVHNNYVHGCSQNTFKEIFGSFYSLKMPYRNLYYVKEEEISKEGWELLYDNISSKSDFEFDELWHQMPNENIKSLIF